MLKIHHYFFLLMAVGLGACSSTPDPTYIDLTITANADLNPDLAARPSPLVLKLVEMKAHTAFSNADYFKLSNNIKTALGPDYISDENMPVRPGEIKKLKLKLHEHGKYIGVIAGYREIDKAKWRYILKPEQEEVSEINLLLTRDAIKSISTSDESKDDEKESDATLNADDAKKAATDAKSGYDTAQGVNQTQGNIDTSPSFKLDNF